MGRLEKLRWGDEEEEEKSWQGPGVGRKRGGRRVDKKAVEWGGGDRIGTIVRRLGGGQWGGEDGEGQREGGDWEGAKGRGRRRGKRRRHFTDGYDSSTWNAWVE